MKRYEIWRGGGRSWAHDVGDTYRWRWLARLVARWRQGAGYFTYQVRERRDDCLGTGRDPNSSEVINDPDWAPSKIKGQHGNWGAGF